MRPALLAVLIASSACGDDDFIRFDAATDGVLVESGPLDGGSEDDFDGDGLCNDTELLEGTDPLSSDTDLDGFPDATEILLGFNPTTQDSPDRERVYILRESATAGLQVPIERDVFGNGEDFVGAFEADSFPDDAGQTAETFFADGVAAFAVPLENVALVDEEAQTIRGVNGRTLLGYEARFAYGDAVQRACTRAYPFRYNIKRSDGSLVGLIQGTLLIMPIGESLTTTDWCVRSGCF